jgi:hypothetical protein
LRPGVWLGWLRAAAGEAGAWLVVLPIAALSIARQLTAVSGSPVEWWHFSYIAEMLQGALTSGFIFATLAIGLALARAGRLLSFAFALVYAALLSGDWFLIWYAKSRLSYLAIASITAGAEGVLHYANAANFGIIGVALAGCCVAAVYANRTASSRGWSAVLGSALLAFFLLAAQPANLLRRAAGLATMTNFKVEPGTARDKINTRYMEAKRFSSGPLVTLIAEVFGRTPAVTVPILPPETRAKAARFIVKPTELASLGRPYRRIILLTLESMSMTLTSRYNPALAGALTPTFDALPESMRNLRCASTPTQFGLASHLCSHPNGEAVVATGHPNALPEYLASKGWKTRFTQSASLDFQGGERRFRELGYQEIVGRNEFAADPAYAGRVSGWGLCDRLVFSSVVDWLDANRGQKTFVHILSADTHAPGRHDYHDLEYPETPQWIRDAGQLREMLESWFRADHDVGLFLRGLRERNLLDEDTAVIVTGDHTYQRSNAYLKLPGIKGEKVERLPWFFISGRSLRPDLDRLSSHIDTAPTIAHLAGLPPLAGWWGATLFARVPARSLLAFHDGETYLLEPSQRETLAASDVTTLGWMIEARGFADRDKPQQFQSQ